MNILLYHLSSCFFFFVVVVVVVVWSFPASSSLLVNFLLGTRNRLFVEQFDFHH